MEVYKNRMMEFILGHLHEMIHYTYVNGGHPSPPVKDVALVHGDTTCCGFRGFRATESKRARSNAISQFLGTVGC